MQVQAELHCHTIFSDGFASPAACVRYAGRKEVSVLAITDHDTAEGALPFWKDRFQHDVLVIPGEEVSTELGHVLAYFVRRSIHPGPFKKVIAEIHAQGALAFMAHPYHIPLGNRWRKRNIYKLEAQHLAQLNGLEVENAHNRAHANTLAHHLAMENSLASIAGSDAHHPFEIGNCRTEINVTEITYDGVRQALMDSASLVAVSRKWNAYPVYLWVGLLNRLTGRKYLWKEFSSRP